MVRPGAAFTRPQGPREGPRGSTTRAPRPRAASSPAVYPPAVYGGGKGWGWGAPQAGTAGTAAPRHAFAPSLLVAGWARLGQAGGTRGLQALRVASRHHRPGSVKPEVAAPRRLLCCAAGAKLFAQRSRLIRPAALPLCSEERGGAELVQTR